MKPTAAAVAFVVTCLLACNLRLVAVDSPAFSPPPVPTSRSVATSRPAAVAASAPTMPEWYADANAWQYIAAAVGATGMAVGYIISRKRK